MPASRKLLLWTTSCKPKQLVLALQDAAREVLQYRGGTALRIQQEHGFAQLETGVRESRDEVCQDQELLPWVGTAKGIQS